MYIEVHRCAEMYREVQGSPLGAVRRRGRLQRCTELLRDTERSREAREGKRGRERSREEKEVGKV